MSYTVKRTNGTTVAEVADQTIVTSEVPVALVGRGAVNYGQAHSENFVKLCENFANSTPPSKPMVGMLSRANTCVKSRLFGRDVFIRLKTNAGNCSFGDS